MVILLYWAEGGGRAVLEPDRKNLWMRKKTQLRLIKLFIYPGDYWHYAFTNILHKKIHRKAKVEIESESTESVESVVLATGKEIPNT